MKSNEQKLEEINKKLLKIIDIYETTLKNFSKETRRFQKWELIDWREGDCDWVWNEELTDRAKSAKNLLSIIEDKIQHIE